MCAWQVKLSFVLLWIRRATLLDSAREAHDGSMLPRSLWTRLVGGTTRVRWRRVGRSRSRGASRTVLLGVTASSSVTRPAGSPPVIMLPLPVGVERDGEHRALPALLFGRIALLLPIVSRIVGCARGAEGGA